MSSTYGDPDPSVDERWTSPDAPAGETATNGQAIQGETVRERLESPSVGGAGDSTSAAVADALRVIQTRPGHDERGRFVARNVEGGKSLSRSEVLWAELAGAKAELAARVRADLGADDGAAETFKGVVDAYAEARLLRSSLFVRMSEAGGPITTKGRIRALFNAYLSTLDREQRLAVTLGLERRARPLPSVAEWVSEQAAANRGERAG